MKIFMPFALAALMLVTWVSSSLAAGSCMKVWNYGYTANKYDWVFQYRDPWGGDNDQCSANGSVCGLWDWRAVYNGNCSAVPTPPETNTAEYGDYLVHEQAAHDGIVLPSNLGLPTYSVYFNCGGGWMR